MNRLERFSSLLTELKQKGAYRKLRPAAGADFSSNDYLALADDTRIRAALMSALERGVPSGAGGSRLLRGNHPEHEALEADAARYFHAERALFFGSGYAANTALLSTLPQRDDLVVYDALVHASAHDGMKLGRAPVTAFAHNEVQAAADAIETWRNAGGTGTPWLVVESLYSMEGDRAPLADLHALAQRVEAFLLIDEAHATGVYGPGGRGLASAFEGSDHVIALHTGGKALGAGGALVTGPAVLCDFLVNRARPFIFATAAPPLVAVALREALRVLEEEPERRTQLSTLADHARQQLQATLGLKMPDSHILPVVIGESEATLRIAEAVQAAGFDVRAIRPPTVRAGTSRLRLSITLHVNAATIEALVAAIAEAMPGPAPQQTSAPTQ